MGSPAASATDTKNEDSLIVVVFSVEPMTREPADSSAA